MCLPNKTLLPIILKCVLNIKIGTERLHKATDTNFLVMLSFYLKGKITGLHKAWMHWKICPFLNENIPPRNLWSRKRWTEILNYHLFLKKAIKVVRNRKLPFRMVCVLSFTALMSKKIQGFLAEEPLQQLSIICIFWNVEGRINSHSIW